MLSESELKNLKDLIGKLEDFQKTEIFKIISDNDIKYTQNKNGVFLNMKNLNDKCINNINNYLNFIDKQ